MIEAGAGAGSGASAGVGDGDGDGDGAEDCADVNLDYVDATYDDVVICFV